MDPTLNQVCGKVVLLKERRIVPLLRRQWVLLAVRIALSTGLTNHAGGASKCPDFHWVSCVLETGTVAFTGTSILMYDVLSGQNRGSGDVPRTGLAKGPR